MFRKASLVEVDGQQRLSFPNLETWSASGRPSLAQAGVDWPQRVATHCHYMADKVTHCHYMADKVTHCHYMADKICNNINHSSLLSKAMRLCANVWQCKARQGIMRVMHS